MICMKNKTILVVLILFGVFLFGVISASACDNLVAVRYSYGNSYGTGIALGYGNGTWIAGNPASLNESNNYTIKYYIDNSSISPLGNISVIVRLDNLIIANYTKNANKEHYPTNLFLNTESLCGAHIVYLEVVKEGDCDLSDNSASRQIYVNCVAESPTPTCGDGVCNNNENCSICSTDCGSCPTPPTNNTNQTEPERIINVSHKNSFVQFCNANWICSGWSECSNGVITRECADKNHCDTEYNKPYEKSGCDEKISSNAYVDNLNTNYIWIIIAGTILFLLLLIIIINLLK